VFSVQLKHFVSSSFCHPLLVAVSLLPLAESAMVTAATLPFCNVDTSREEARPALAFSLVVGGRSSNVSFRSHGSRQFHSMFGQLILEIEYAETEQGSARLSYATERFPTRLDVFPSRTLPMILFMAGVTWNVLVIASPRSERHGARP
jgi:hypothetical protein